MPTANQTATRSAALLLALVLGLAGCSSSGDDGGDDEPGGTGTLEDSRATVSGVSFEVPSEWTLVDPSEVADGAAGTEEVQDLADALGVQPAELEAAMAGVDLYVFDGAGEATSFRDNINVTSPEGSIPSEEQVTSEFEGLGATVGESEVVDTELGDAITITYQLPAGATTVQGEAIIVESNGSAVVITVSATDAAVTDEVATQIIDSLTEAE